VVLVKGLDGAFHVLDTRSAIQTAGADEGGVRVEGDSADLAVMTNQLGHTFARGYVPDIGSAVKRTCHNFVPERIVECEGLDHIVMTYKRVEFLGIVCILEPAGAVIAACNETCAIFIKTNVGKGQIMALDFLVLALLLVASVLLLLDQL